MCAIQSWATMADSMYLLVSNAGYSQRRYGLASHIGFWATLFFLSPADMVPLFRKTLVPLATILTPNQFELEQITGRPITS